MSGSDEKSGRMGGMGFAELEEDDLGGEACCVHGVWVFICPYLSDDDDDGGDSVSDSCGVSITGC